MTAINLSRLDNSAGMECLSRRPAVSFYPCPPYEKRFLPKPAGFPFARQIEEIVLSTPVVDIHTHLYDAAFKDLLLWGIDDLLGLSLSGRRNLSLY